MITQPNLSSDEEHGTPLSMLYGNSAANCGKRRLTFPAARLAMHTLSRTPRTNESKRDAVHPQKVDI